MRVNIPQIDQSTVTDDHGEFTFAAVPPGVYRLDAAGAGYLPQEIVGIRVLAGRVTIMDTQEMPLADEVTHLAPYVVTGESDRERLFDGSGAYLGPRVAAGNLDLPRTANDALPLRRLRPPADRAQRGGEFE